MRSVIGRSGLLVLAIGATACADKLTLGPGDALVGSWIDQNTHVVATHSSLTWRSRCEAATFPPITLDSAGQFSIESTSYQSVANIQLSPETELHISGRVINRELVLNRYLVHSGLGSDPVSITLAPGSSNDPLVCNA